MFGSYHIWIGGYSPSPFMGKNNRYKDHAGRTSITEEDDNILEVLPPSLVRLFVVFVLQSFLSSSKFICTLCLLIFLA